MTVRLYSPEWIDAFNEAVAGLVPEPGVSFRMLQIVDGGPDGSLRVTLEVGIDGGGIVLDAARGPAGQSPPEPQVTVMVGYDDAAALARGAVDPAALLRDGRVKVRGDLSVLVAGQEILIEAARRLGALSEDTTF